jgi:hypothetical protein
MGRDLSGPGSVEIDLELLVMGYLRAVDGRTRRIHGLDAVARFTLLAGIRVFWGTPVRGGIACSYLHRRRVVLSPRVFRLEPHEVLDVWTHELGHIACGTRCGAARAWRDLVFGEVLQEVASS